MNKIYLLNCLFVLFSLGCSKEKGCKSVEPKDEETRILAFAAANGISNPVKHNSGIYYQVVTPGTGVAPSINSLVTVNYTGQFLNGTTFNKSAVPVDISLGRVIEGWQIGIPLIKKGGTIKLIIPSAYAYGCNGKEGIAPNEVLYFEVDLINVL
jgi:FKBP-type peptidyl-prolyl cis-trans isomerase